MMIKPGISELMEGMDSRYTLAMIVAKRARELALDTTTPLVKIKSDKAVTIAVNEVAEGMIDVINHCAEAQAPAFAASDEMKQSADLQTEE